MPLTGFTAFADFASDRHHQATVKRTIAKAYWVSISSAAVQSVLTARQKRGHKRNGKAHEARDEQ
jgi:hypothetical protein